MEYNEDKVSGLKIAYIGGGSKAWAWSVMRDLALEGQLEGTVGLYDINYKAACENRDLGNSLNNRKDVRARWKYDAFQNLEDALEDADFIVISILPGTFKEMHSDVYTPEKYGIYQSVGDTVGPGGLFRALRTIPIYVEIAKKIKSIAPDAWVLNYTNPMSICIRTFYEVFPQIKAFGCCHGVFETQALLTHVLREIRGIEGVKRSDIKMNVLGINHFTWVDRAYYRTMDLMPVFMEFIEKYALNGYEPKGEGTWEKSVFSNANRVVMDLSRRYGIIAASPDRHVVEFLPPWYLKDIDTVRHWKFHLTTVDKRIEDAGLLEQRRKKILNGEKAFELHQSGEEGVLQIKALLGLTDMVTNVNMPNKGQMEDMPKGSIVETNALITRDNIFPVCAGQLPEDVRNLTLRHVLNQEAILKAALSRDKELAFKAFINDPLVTIGLSEARELFDSMLYNIREYLPDWNI